MSRQRCGGFKPESGALTRPFLGALASTAHSASGDDRPGERQRGCAGASHRPVGRRSSKESRELELVRTCTRTEQRGAGTNDDRADHSHCGGAGATEFNAHFLSASDSVPKLMHGEDRPGGHVLPISALGRHLIYLMARRGPHPARRARNCSRAGPRDGGSPSNPVGDHPRLALGFYEMLGSTDLDAMSRSCLEHGPLRNLELSRFGRPAENTISNITLGSALLIAWSRLSLNDTRHEPLGRPITAARGSAYPPRRRALIVLLGIRATPAHSLPVGDAFASGSRHHGRVIAPGLTFLPASPRSPSS